MEAESSSEIAVAYGGGPEYLAGPAFRRGLLGFMMKLCSYKAKGNGGKNVFPRNDQCGMDQSSGEI